MENTVSNSEGPGHPAHLHSLIRQNIRSSQLDCYVNQIFSARTVDERFSLVPRASVLWANCMGNKCARVVDAETSLCFIPLLNATILCVF